MVVPCSNGFDGFGFALVIYSFHPKLKSTLCKKGKKGKSSETTNDQRMSSCSMPFDRLPQPS